MRSGCALILFVVGTSAQPESSLCSRAAVMRGMETAKMRKLFLLSAATAALLVAGSVSAFAACNGDTGTETVLGAASGAAVGGLASRSVAGAAIGGVAGGLIGNAIGQSNNREDCRREAQYYDQQRQDYYADQQSGYGQ